MNGFLNTDESPGDPDVEYLMPDCHRNEAKASHDSEKVGKVRYTLAYMGFLGFFLVYAMRINISVALVDMVEQDAKNDDVNGNCPVDDNNSVSYHPGKDNAANKIQCLYHFTFSTKFFFQTFI